MTQNQSEAHTRHSWQLVTWGLVSGAATFKCRKCPAVKYKKSYSDNGKIAL